MIARSLSNLLAPLVAFGLLVAWEIITALTSIPEILLPSPISIISKIASMPDRLTMHAMATLKEVLVGFLIALAGGVFLASLMTQVRPIGRALFPLLIVTQTMPIIAVAPLLVIWFGPGEVARLIEGTISCWYHGFTFDIESGNLVSIVAAPTDDLIGKVRVRTFPVQEHKGMIFVFVGDEDYTPVPPLWHDLPLQPPADQPMRHSHLLDDDVVLLGIRRTTNANWRLGVENGFDPGHVLIHRDNILILATGRPMALGYKPVKPEALQIIEGDGPKGVKNMYGTDSYEPVVRNEKLNIECAARADFKFTGVRTSMYLPGVLMVENFPEPTLAQYEWYVPIDDKRHEYWQVIARRCATPKEREDFEFRYKHLYEPVALRDFNDNDIFARQAMQPFYENGGWTDEKLCSMDAAVVSWRKLAARYNRGIQPPM